MPFTLQTCPDMSQSQRWTQLGCPSCTDFQSPWQIVTLVLAGDKFEAGTLLSSPEPALQRFVTPASPLNPLFFFLVPQPTICAPVLVRAGGFLGWVKFHLRAGLRKATGKPEMCHFVFSTKLERAGSAKWLPPFQPLHMPSDSSLSFDSNVPNPAACAALPSPLCPEGMEMAGREKSLIDASDCSFTNIYLFILNISDLPRNG